MSVFFSDRDLGKEFGEVLRGAGIEMQRFFEHFDDREADEDWIPVVAKRGWFIITHDERIRYRPNERDAVMQSGAGLFILVGAAPAGELARNFVATVARIEAFIAKHRRPFIAKVYRPVPSDAPGGPGRVEIWLTAAQWRAARRRRR